MTATATDSSFHENDDSGNECLPVQTYPGVLTLGGSCPPPRARRRRTVSIRT